MPLYGVDVASHQGRPDWVKAYRTGVRFGFSKVTESTGYVNPTWAHNRAGMLALGDGFVPGAYHFLHGGNGAAQARWFLDHAGDVSGFAVALDVEASGANAATARAWVAEFKDRTGGHPVIGYYPRWYWEQTGRPDLSFFDTLWQSRYVTGAGSPDDLYGKVPAPWWDPFGGEPVSVLQFSSSASVPGVTGRCDVNAYRGTVDELRALTLGTPTPPPEDTLKIQLNMETTKPLAVPPGKRASVGFDAEKYDVGWHNVPQAAWFPAEFAYYLVTVSLTVEGPQEGGGLRVVVAAYERDTNELVGDVHTEDKTISGETRCALSGLVWMGPDRKYRLDVVNLGGAPVTITGAALRIAR